MASQLETFRIVAPEMAGTDDQTVLQFLSLAALRLNPDFYPESVRGLALVYKAASMLFERDQASSGANTAAFVTLEKEGDLMRQYAPVKGFNGRTIRNSYEGMLEEITPKGGFIFAGGFCG